MSTHDQPPAHSPGQPSGPPPDQPPMGVVIDCDTCVARATAACHDCLVTFLVRNRRDDAVVIDLAEVRALRTLGDGGLVPRLRHVAHGPANGGEIIGE